MKLVYNKSRKEVQVGDEVTLRDGAKAVVTDIIKPHKPASTGRVVLDEGAEKMQRTYFPSVIGAEWINREDW